MQSKAQKYWQTSGWARLFTRAANRWFFRAPFCVIRDCLTLCYPVGTLISEVLSVSEGRKASEKQKHSISLCTDGDLQVVQRLNSARRYRVAGIEFSKGGFPPW